jgi:AraC-like DNA-binding protein
VDLNNLSPYIRVAIDYTVSPNWHIKKRAIFDYELFFVKEGEVLVTIEGVDYHGIPGDLFLLKPKQQHSMKLVGDILLRHPHLHFDLYYYPDSPNIKVSFKPLKDIEPSELSWFRKDDCSTPPYDVPNHIRLKNPIIIEKMIFDIIHEFEHKTPFYEHTCKGIFILLWIQLMKELYWDKNQHVLTNLETLNKIKLFMLENLNEDIELDDLARMANFSKCYFIRIFKNAFGTTPLKYHQMLRIEKAKEWVQYSSLPLTEIAEIFGFQNIHAFSRSFKKVDGVKPTFYRRRSGKG